MVKKITIQIKVQKNKDGVILIVGFKIFVKNYVKWFLKRNKVTSERKKIGKNT